MTRMRLTSLSTSCAMAWVSASALRKFPAPGEGCASLCWVLGIPVHVNPCTPTAAHQPMPCSDPACNSLGGRSSGRTTRCGGDLYASTAFSVSSAMSCAWSPKEVARSAQLMSEAGRHGAINLKVGSGTRVRAFWWGCLRVPNCCRRCHVS